MTGNPCPPPARDDVTGEGGALAGDTPSVGAVPVPQCGDGTQDFDRTIELNGVRSTSYA
jgi:hypothetical protein